MTRPIAVALITFLASVLGMLLQSLVPADVLTASKGPVGAMAGVVALLLALVLGLLIWTAFAVFTGQQSDAMSLGPLIAEVDLLLERCGPGATPGRAGLRASLRRSRQRFFAAATGPQMLTIVEIKSTLAGIDEFFGSAAAADATNRPLIETARGLARKYHETQMSMLIRLASPFPPRVLDIVVFWSAILFLGDGLVATPNVVTVAAHFVGAVGIASATFLILELSHPYNGFIRLAPAGLDRVIETLGEVSLAPAE